MFLPCIFILYWYVDKEYRWVILLAASYYFYMSWDAKYVVFIAGTTLVTWIGGNLLWEHKSIIIRKCLLGLCLASCLGLLFYFKYFNFAVDILNDVFSSLAIPLHASTKNLIIPVGISFYTFQTLSYVIDIYKGELQPERNLGYYATYISFFPQLVAGPIERADHLLPQIHEKREFDYSKAVSGMHLILWGFFKKIVIADTFSGYVDKVFNNVTQYQGIPIILATLFFTIQIYCDFSGYSDIAIGSARLFNIDLMTNFNCPYFSSSFEEFWRRWHISLSTWMRDYIYIPLGGSRCSIVRKNFNLLCTFLISGLWHGAAWHYVLWGGTHGALLITEKFFKSEYKEENSIKTGMRMCLTFIGVSAMWMFFRVNSTSDMVWILKNFWRGWYKFSLAEIDERWLSELIMVFILLGYDYLEWKQQGVIEKRIQSMSKPMKYGIYILAVLVLFYLLPVEYGKVFVYFQF